MSMDELKQKLGYDIGYDGKTIRLTVEQFECLVLRAVNLHGGVPEEDTSWWVRKLRDDCTDANEKPAIGYRARRALEHLADGLESADM